MSFTVKWCTGAPVPEPPDRPLCTGAPEDPRIPYGRAVTASWIRELRRLHGENFHRDWKSHVGALNRELGLRGRGEPGLPAPELPPPWFVGDVEALREDEWVLVFSLNQARREEDEQFHRDQRHTEQSYWDY